jgi:hypothetical protein
MSGMDGQGEKGIHWLDFQIDVFEHLTDEYDSLCKNSPCDKAQIYKIR